MALLRLCIGTVRVVGTMIDAVESFSQENFTDCKWYMHYVHLCAYVYIGAMTPIPI